MRRIITARLDRLMCNQNRTLSTLIALQMTHSSLRKSQSFLLFYTLSGVLSHSHPSCILFSILWNSMQPICDRDCIICASTQLCKYGPARCKTTERKKLYRKFVQVKSFSLSYEWIKVQSPNTQNYITQKNTEWNENISHFGWFAMHANEHQ